MPTNYLTLQIFMKTICSFQFELTQKLKQLNIKFLIIPLVKREAESLQSETFACSSSIWSRVNANIAKCKVIVPVMDGFRRYAHARVITDFKNMVDYHEERTLKACEKSKTKTRTTATRLQETLEK